MRNAKCLILLFTVLAFSKLSVPTTANDSFSKELIGQCAAVMSAPIRFKVMLIQHKEKNGDLIRESFLAKLRGSDVSRFLKPRGMENLEKGIRETRSKGVEYVVSIAEESMRPVTRIEQGSPRQTVIVIGYSRCLEFYPKQNIGIDNTVMLRDVQSVWEEMTEVYRLQGDVVCIDDSADKWLCLATSEKLIVELRIFKSSKFVESKRIIDRNSKELLKEYRYSEFESGLFPTSFFGNGSATVLIAENTKDFYAKFMNLLKDETTAHYASFEDELKRDVMYKVDLKTGRQVLHPPSGMSNEDFARGIGEAIEKLPTPKGVSLEMKKELAEKWKANTELKPIDLDLDPPRKADRGYGSVWLYLVIFLALGTAVVVGIRFWRAN